MREEGLSTRLPSTREIRTSIELIPKECYWNQKGQAEDCHHHLNMVEEESKEGGSLGTELSSAGWIIGSGGLNLDFSQDSRVQRAGCLLQTKASSTILAESGWRGERTAGMEPRRTRGVEEIGAKVEAV